MGLGQEEIEEYKDTTPVVIIDNKQSLKCILKKVTKFNSGVKEAPIIKQFEMEIDKPDLCPNQYQEYTTNYKEELYNTETVLP